MTTDDNITAARSAVALIDTEGKEREFLFSPMTDRDSDELTLWLRQRMILLAGQSVAGQSPEIQQAVTGPTLIVASSLTWRSAEGQAMLLTSEGIARLAWQHLQHSQKKTSYREILEVYFGNSNPNSGKNVDATMDYIWPEKEENKDGEPGGNPTPTTEGSQT